MSDARRAKVELGIAVACSLIALGVALWLSMETKLFGEERVLAESSVRVAATPAEGENVTVFEPLALDEARPIDVHVDRAAGEGTLDLDLALVEVDGGEVYETALTSPARERVHAAFGRVAEGRYLLRVEGHWHPELGSAATTARIRVVEAPSSPAVAILFAAALLLPIPFAYARYRSASPPAKAGGEARLRGLPRPCAGAWLACGGSGFWFFPRSGTRALGAFVSPRHEERACGWTGLRSSMP